MTRSNTKKAAPSQEQADQAKKAKAEGKDTQPEESQDTQSQAGEGGGGDTGQSGVEAQQFAEETANPQPSYPVVETGPGTGRPAPPDESFRYPSTMVDPTAAPLDPPADAHTQVEPAAGYNMSSTDPVYAEAGGRTIAGEDFIRLENGDGGEVSGDSMFDDDPSKTFVEVKERVYEVFYYANTHEEAKRLMFVPGQRVPRAQAERIKAAVENAPEPKANMTAAQRRGDRTADSED